MKRFFKLLAWLAGIVVVLIVAAVIIIPLVFDPNAYRDTIAQVVREQTGRELTIQGDIKLSVFPWLGVELGALELGNAKGFGPEPFARIAGADVSVKLLPLLRRKVEMNTVVLRGLQLHLARDAHGKGNWEDLVPAAKAEAPREEPPAPAASPLESLAALAIGGIDVSDAGLVWDDRMTGQHAAVEHLNLESGALRLNAPFPLRIDLDVAGTKPDLKGHLAFSARVTLDPQAQRYRLAGTELTARLDSPLVPGGTAALSLAADVDADLTKQTASLRGLRLDAQGLRVEGDADASRILALPDVSGALRLAVVDPGRLLGPFTAQLPAGFEPAALKGAEAKADFSVSLGGQTLDLKRLEMHALGTGLRAGAKGERILGQAAARGRLDLDVTDGGALLAPVAASLPKGMKASALNGAHLGFDYDLDLRTQRLSLKAVTLKALDMAVNAQAEGSKLLDAPAFRGELRTGEFVPRDLAGALGVALPETADPGVLTKAAVTLKFDASTRHAAVKDLVLRLDQSSLKGGASIANWAAPVIRYDLAMDKVDADRYLPPPAPESEKPVGTPVTAAAAGAAQLPLGQLRSLDVDGTVRLGSLKLANLRTTGIHGTLKGKGGVFRLQPVGAKLYGGVYRGNLGLDVRTDTPALTMDEALSGVQVGPLLKDFMGKDYVTGKAELSARLSARGLDPMAVRKTLNGRAAFRFDDGAVKGVNIGQLIREAYAAYKKQPAPKEETRQTDFALLSGTVTVKDGLARNDDLSAKSPLLRVTGKGTANLVSEQVDYRVNAALVGSLEGEGGRELSELRNITIPIRIKGPFSEPRFGVDLGPILEAKAKEALDREKKKLEEKARQKVDEQKKKLEKDLEKKLKNLLKF